MDLLPYLYPLGIGLIAGFIASMILGGGKGLLRKLIIGILGAIVGGALLPALGITLTENLHVNNIITATIGACLLLIVIQFLAKN